MMVSRLLLLFGLIGFALPAFAGRMAYDIGLGMQYYSGKESESLAPNTGTVVRFGAQAGEGILRWATAFYVTSASGKADFDDQGTPVELTYSLLGGEFDFGGAIYPLGGETKLALQPFLAVTGSANLSSISFSKDADVSDEFPKSDAGMMFGYALIVGADISFSKEWGMKLSVERNQLSGTLAGSTFGLSGERILLGFYFR